MHCPLRDKLTLRDLNTLSLNQLSWIPIRTQNDFQGSTFAPYTFAFDSKIDIHQYQWSPDVSITLHLVHQRKVWQTDRHTCRQAHVQKTYNDYTINKSTKVMWYYYYKMKSNQNVIAFKAKFQYIFSLHTLQEEHSLLTGPQKICNGTLDRKFWLNIEKKCTWRTIVKPLVDQSEPLAVPAGALAFGL